MSKDKDPAKPATNKEKFKTAKRQGSVERQGPDR